MTTKVTVDAHAGWPVQVEAVDKYPGSPVSQHVLGVVPPNQVREFYVHSTRALIITEMPKAAS